MRMRQGNSPLPLPEEFAMITIVWRFRWADREIEIRLIISYPM